MNYKKMGIIQIKDDLKLKDFTWRVKSIYYDFDTRKASIEVLMKEKSYEHSRSFSLAVAAAKTGLSKKEVIEFLLKQTCFKDSVEA